MAAPPVVALGLSLLRIHPLFGDVKGKADIDSQFLLKWAEEMTKSRLSSCLKPCCPLKRTHEPHVTCFSWVTLASGHVTGVKLAHPGVISPMVPSLLLWGPDMNVVGTRGKPVWECQPCLSVVADNRLGLWKF